MRSASAFTTRPSTLVNRPVANLARIRVEFPLPSEREAADAADRIAGRNVPDDD
jgi:hypothetical protein